MSHENCYHCGLPVLPGLELSVVIDEMPRAMCCVGCQAVAQAIVDNGLADYYRNRDALPDGPREALPAILDGLTLYDNADFQKNFVRELGEGEREASLIIEGITCAACIWLNEQHVAKLPGVVAMQINFVRYADDFIVTGSSKGLLEGQVKPLIEAFMAERGLQLSPEKTLVTHIEEGFDFLGQNVRKYNGTLLIKPSKKNVQTFLRGLKETLDRNKMATAGEIVMLLNPKIRGWANYHRHVVSSRMFSYVDDRLWHMLWRWCRRRHHNAPRRWITDKYFGRHQGRNWIFTGDRKDGSGKCWLFKANMTAIKRHTKIKSEANPYDVTQEAYFESRQMARIKEGRLWSGKLRLIWERQARRCIICGQRFHDDSDWDVHHIVMQIKGGGDETENLVMLHPNCHRQYHAVHQGDNAGFEIGSEFSEA